jgi:hypothetical protein
MMVQGGGAVSYERGTPVYPEAECAVTRRVNPCTLHSNPYTLHPKSKTLRLQGYLAHKKMPTPLEPP